MAFLKDFSLKGEINFHILLQNSGSNSKILGALQNPERSHPSLVEGHFKLLLQSLLRD